MYVNLEPGDIDIDLLLAKVIPIAARAMLALG